MNSKISEEFYSKLSDMIQFLVPQYIEEGKQHLVIGIDVLVEDTGQLLYQILYMKI